MAQTFDRTERLEVPAGVANLPGFLRDLARQANRAGLEGYELIEAEYGLDVDEAVRAGRKFPTTRFLMRYQRRQECPAK